MALIARTFMVSFCILVFAGSVQLFRLEYPVAVLQSETAIQQIATLSDPSLLGRPASVRSTRDLATTCGRLMTDAPALKADPALKNRTYASCGWIAESILARAPQNGRALTVAMLANASTVSSAAYTQARASAPHEPWQVLKRLDALALSGETGKELAEAAKADITFAVQTSWGRKRLVRLYEDRPDLRSTIVQAAEASPEASQRSFVSELSVASQGFY